MSLTEIWESYNNCFAENRDLGSEENKEYPPLPRKIYGIWQRAGEQQAEEQRNKEKKRKKKHLEKFRSDPGGTIEYWRRRLRSVYHPVPIDRSMITPGLKLWEQSCLEKDDALDEYECYLVCPVRRAEKRIWTRVDPSLKYYMKIPFFLIGLDHPLKAQQGLSPEEEKQWLPVRRAITFSCEKDEYDYHSAYVHYRHHPVKEAAGQYFNWLSDLYYKSPELIEERWRPVSCGYPNHMIRSSRRGISSIWNTSCQTWQLGPINDQERVIFIGRIDDQVVSSFRCGQIVVPLELSARLEWNNLLEEIIQDLPKAIEISQRFHRLIDDSYDFDFSQLTVEQVHGLKDQAPDPTADSQIPIENFQANQPINLVRRLTQDLGSTIITEWIFTDQVKRCYLYDYDSYHLARPIFLSHAKNLIRNCCFGCGAQFLEYCHSQRISVPIGYNLYYQEYGFHSRFDYDSKIFVFPPDQEDIGEFCDDCIDVMLAEGKAV